MVYKTQLGTMDSGKKEEEERELRVLDRVVNINWYMNCHNRAAQKSAANLNKMDRILRFCDAAKRYYMSSTWIIAAVAQITHWAGQLANKARDLPKLVGKHPKRCLVPDVSAGEDLDMLLMNWSLLLRSNWVDVPSVLDEDLPRGPGSHAPASCTWLRLKDERMRADTTDDHEAFPAFMVVIMCHVDTADEELSGPMKATWATVKNTMATSKPAVFRGGTWSDPKGYHMKFPADDLLIAIQGRAYVPVGYPVKMP